MAGGVDVREDALQGVREVRLTGCHTPPAAQSSVCCPGPMEMPVAETPRKLSMMGPKLDLDISGLGAPSDGVEGAPLLAAAGRGDNREVVGLLKDGADVDLADWSGCTGLMLAVRGGHTTVVRTLLSAGAQVGLTEW